MVPLGAGLALGALFFGGLWWTVRRAVASPWVALWFLASLLLRTGAVVLGLFAACGSDWKRWLAGLLGFSLARVAATRLALSPLSSSGAPREAGHAP